MAFASRNGHGPGWDLRDGKKYSRDMKKYSIRHLPFDAKEGVPQTRRVCRNVWYRDRLGHKSQTERLVSVTY